MVNVKRGLMRLGIIASVIWVALVVGRLIYELDDRYLDRYFVASLVTVEAPDLSKFGTPAQLGEPEFERRPLSSFTPPLSIPTLDWMQLLAVALAPVAIFWALGATIYFAGKWAYDGFTDLPKGADSAPVATEDSFDGKAGESAQRPAGLRVARRVLKWAVRAVAVLAALVLNSIALGILREIFGGGGFVGGAVVGLLIAWLLVLAWRVTARL